MEPSVFFQSLFSTNVIPNLLLLSRPQCLYFIVDMTKDGVEFLGFSFQQR